ncbi:pyridine nucleotide-disulfide oxidoreductase family protein [Clostridium pasteurianum DSM 525 = ATCC 6013]|uniref:HI0933 family protein n=1 Tax=Clostridium pasteurianum DSM 525 = ATCC 6013 TaxID=1262449 RepID=A0A0H3J9V6_CLOPA|nr:NAD(P)/FAD-dependent oxidoreductase [Clostridium pasteurianum]AJA48015.1 pyridine nucleotide-disulfide oxidoreductase family protein [Clostridium pasteurianum DSM 525 = ATCC 6013]AJA52003.1 pyridine nucleotide-disulfide oxidoreductase family protein [Clostridium pasteurianum DSM 525 = ATCC 6013]AOZ75298.1 FAD-dependent oxidoreductase [Clostridium pasteurianum DSM 525 = ATCC 6013]AOZ79093.1 FAD-dependent oxidoreductase [Clostridium pasteurianum]ELP59918.1 NAD(FAD)-utilizing dehydrogenase [Cl
MKKVIVIGGGPAGIMAAMAAAEKNKVILIERNEKLGKKLYITGKGRCNVTNNKDISEFFDYIPGNPEFLYSSLYTYTNFDVMNYFENMGIRLKVERGDRVFPKSDKSSDIINALKRSLENKNVEIMLNTRISSINIENGNIKSLVTDEKNIIKGDHFIICTGGLSYPQTGSTGDGLDFAREAGHNITEIKPSLVPIEINEDWISNLQGLSLRNVELSIMKKNKIIYRDFGEMLFTHYGISGPIVLKASRMVNEKENMSVLVNLKPALKRDELDKRIQRDFTKFSNKDFKNSLNELLPQKLINTIVNLSGIDENKKVNSITREERKNLVDIIQKFTLSIKGLRDIKEAIVTSGGVDIKEIDPSTLRSRIINNMSFAGEVMDVDAYTGGYNIQIAFSTGYLAGKSV